ncbi:cache domain-containing sensor histidine kinase [Cohnella hongkongensis]|uniref:Sensor histidine kinase n=1 Tax=Cohnella hongkongensis TaxID=178337 RepID=A0ABV9FDZ8_9BACL
MSKISSGLSKTTSGKPLANIDDSSRIKQFFHPRLKRRFFLDHFFRFLGPCLIPIILLGTLSIVITNRYIGNVMESNNERVLNQHKEFLQLIVSEMDSLSLTFGTDAKVRVTLKHVLTRGSYAYEDVQALMYIKSVIDVPAYSKPFIHSIYVYLENDYKRFLSSRENLSYMDAFHDQMWLELYRRHPDKQLNEIITVKRSIQEFGVGGFSNEIVSVYKPFAHDRGLIVFNIQPEYFESAFDKMQESRGQTTFIANANGERLMHAGKSALVDVLPAEKIAESIALEQSQTFKLSGNLVSVKHIPGLNWLLVTVNPMKDLYGTEGILTTLTIALALCSVMASIALAYWLTRKNYRQVYRIIDTLNSADRHAARASGKADDLYEVIIQHILESFLQQKYLKVQLSERKYKEQALELKSLQLQINPHFLNNTLHSIYWKSIELTRAPNAVTQMVAHLSDLLDYAVRSAEELVMLEEELIYLRSYVHIQQMRYPNRLDVQWDPIEGWEACRVLKLGLQPLIENSILHGLEHQDRLRIKIRFRKDDQSLKVTIIDNGAGISRERMREIETRLASEEEQTDHVGLFNTFKRLGLKYENRSAIRILSRPGQGTAVTVWFPQTTDAEPNA